MKMRQSIRVARVSDKQARENGENRFEGLPVHLRKALVADPGELDFKRSLLSSDPKLREKIHSLKSAIERLRTKYPEIIGMTLFGSQVKGYSNNESDIDACIYVDEEKVRLFPHKEGPQKHTMDLPRFLQIKEDIDWGISYAGLKEESRGISIYLISKNMVVERCQGGSFGSFSDNLMRLFHPAAGKEIYEYRELVISTLEKMGDKGEENWRNLMQAVFDSENTGLSPELRQKRRKLYPKTLAEGRKYFLSHAPNNTDAL